MRILLVNDYSTPTGGAEVYVLSLRQALRNAGHDAMLFASSVGSQALRRADFECWGTSQKMMNRILQTYNPIASRSMKKILREFRPDIVHLNIFLTQLSPSILRVLEDVPVVYTAHWYRAICPKGTKLLPDARPCDVPAGIACHQNKCLPLPLWWFDMLQLQLLKKFFKKIDFVVANSETTNRRLARAGVISDRVIPYFVNAPSSPVRRSSQTPAICFLGRLVDVKGADVLIQAVKLLVQRIPSVRLIIAGDGPEKPALQKLTNDLNLEKSVEFLGYVPNNEIASLWGKCDVLAVPSLWEEPFGIVAAEALAARVPVVATRGGGLEEIVEDHRSGYLVEPGNIEDLAAKLYNVLTDHAAAQQMGEYGQAQMQKRFSMQSHVDQLLEVYDQLIQKNGNREVVNKRSIANGFRSH